MSSPNLAVCLSAMNNLAENPLQRNWYTFVGGVELEPKQIHDLDSTPLNLDHSQ